MMRRVATVDVVDSFDGHGDLSRIASLNKYAAVFSELFNDRKNLRRLLGEANEKNQVVGKVEKDFFYVVARSLTSTRNDLGQKPIPNGNGDCFVHTELVRTHNQLGIPHYKTFIGKGVFINHQSDKVEACFGTQLDTRVAFSEPPIGKADTSVYNLLAIDKAKAQDLGIFDGIRTGYQKTWSMGCDIEAAVCSICGNTIRSDQDSRCEHIIPGVNKGKYMLSDAEQFPQWAGKQVKASDILIAPSFVELSAVTVPADYTAETIETIGEIDMETRQSEQREAVNLDITTYQPVSPSKETMRKVDIVSNGNGSYTVIVEETHSATFADMQTAVDYVESIKRQASVNLNFKDARTANEYLNHRFSKQYDAYDDARYDSEKDYEQDSEQELESNEIESRGDSISPRAIKNQKMFEFNFKKSGPRALAEFFAANRSKRGSR